MRTSLPDLKSRPLNPRQKNALQMTLDGFSKNEICERLGITQKTLWNWRRLPTWNEEINVVLNGFTDDGQGQIKSMLPLATRRLQQLIHSQTETVALGACRTVLEAHANLIQREEQVQMMTELESRLQELQGIAQAQGLMAKASTAETDASEAVIETDSVIAGDAETQLEMCQ